MHLISRKPNERLLQVKRRATFGKAVRAAPEMQAPPPAASVEAAPGAAATIVPDSGDGIEGSRRRSQRVAVSADVGIRRIGSFHFQAGLHDVSAGGCRVELIEQYEVGDQLIARLPKLEPLGARVRWARGTSAGIEFLNGMHPAVFDSLLVRLGKPEKSGESAPV
jgi:hypothetical protein